jgi:hypothetical protein
MRALLAQLPPRPISREPTNVHVAEFNLGRLLCLRRDGCHKKALFTRPNPAGKVRDGHPTRGAVQSVPSGFLLRTRDERMGLLLAHAPPE